MYLSENPFNNRSTLLEVDERDLYLLTRATIRLYVHETDARGDNPTKTSVMTQDQYDALRAMMRKLGARWDELKGDHVFPEATLLIITPERPKQRPASNSGARKARRDDG